jgi:acetyl esterase/lipase
MLRDVAHHYAQKSAKAGNDITDVHYPDLSHAFIHFYSNDGSLQALPGVNARGRSLARERSCKGVGRIAALVLPEWIIGNITLITASATPRSLAAERSSTKRGRTNRGPLCVCGHRRTALRRGDDRGSLR